MKLFINKQEIHFTSLKWSGSKYSAAREINFSVPNHLVPKIENGNYCVLFDGKDEVFQGYIFTIGKSAKSQEFTFTAYDSMIYLINSSGAYNFKNTTLGNVIRKVAADINIKVDSIADSSVGIKLEPMINVNIYEIIMTALREAKKRTGKIYLPIIKNNKLSIIHAGTKVTNFELDENINILDSNFSESIENVKNKIVIVDEKGNRIGTVTGEGLSKWGTFQTVYEKEKGKNPTNEAKHLLQDMDREVSVDAVGNTSCISGKSVNIKDSSTGLKGLFYIDEDSHQWVNGDYTMNLTLNFKNVMED